MASAACSGNAKTGTRWLLSPILGASADPSIVAAKVTSGCAREASTTASATSMEPTILGGV